MIGRSPAFTTLVDTLGRIAVYDVPVLLEGETGTGKELAARAIHYGSRRRRGPFVPVNCGAIPDSLMENELFGHCRGAFTDAAASQPGLVQLANGGTLFLDEIDALSPKGQVTLLRFLQDRQYRPLGGHTQQADVRVIAACNTELDRLAGDRQFRPDLLYRLKIMHVRVPPLRERTGDPEVLASHFLETASTQYHKASRTIARTTLEWFDRYEWPGNIRELENLICREFLMADTPELQIDPPGACARVPAATDPDLSYREAKAQAIAAFDVRFLGQLMERANGSVSLAARIVRTERRHLGRLLKKYQIARSAHRA